MRISRIAHVVVLMLLAASVPSVPLRADSTEQLRIMTFNVPKTNIKSEGINLWENRVAALQEYWQDLDLDILCMQEPKKQDLIDYLKGMPDYVMVGCGRDDGKEKGEHEPIIYNTRRLYVEDYGFFWLSTTPEKPSRSWSSICVRMATWALLHDKRTQARFIVVNTHLDHGTDECRENQIRVVKEQMKQLATRWPDLPMILTGDLNTRTNTKAYELALSTGPVLTDAWTTATEREGTGYTVASSSKKIDYILLSKDIRVKKAYTDVSLRPSGLQFSDHDPHYADLWWPLSYEIQAHDALIDAQEALDNTLSYNISTVKQITNAQDGTTGCQLSADAAETTEGQYFHYLTDGSTATYFHSQYSTLPPNQVHWLQVDLKDNPLENVVMSVTRREGNNGINDRWQDILVRASNDGKEWPYITELHHFGNDELKAQLSDIIALHNTYRYIRFYIMHTPGMRLISGSPMFTASEFQLYSAEVSAESPRYKDAYLTALCSEVEEWMQAQRAALDKGTADEALTAQLITATTNLKNSIIATDRRATQAALLDSVLTIIGSCKGKDYDPQHTLLKQAEGCPLSTNAPTSKKGFVIEALIDDDTDTAFQSDEAGHYPYTEHWIQAALEEPVNEFVLTMQRTTKSRVVNYMPTALRILATNDTTAGHWQDIVDINEGINAKAYTPWSSYCIVLPQAYSYLRIIVLSNVADKTNTHGAAYFNLGEMGIWAPDDTYSDYHQDEKVHTLCDQLTAQLSEARLALNERLLTYDEVLRLYELIQALQDARDQIDRTSRQQPFIQPSDETEVASITRYRLDGTEVTNTNESAIILVKVVYNDGTVEIKKVKGQR